jgi:hypothetical protein
MNECVKCGQAFQTEAKVGRKASYCSIACRRSAELEITRINRRLFNLEEQVVKEKQHVVTGRDFYGADQPQRITKLKNAIAEEEARLRILFAAKGD